MSGGPVIVTGAGGFVCSEIALAIARTGRDVVAVDRHFDKQTTDRLCAIRRIEKSLEKGFAELRGLAPSVVIHGAAITAAPEELGLSHASHIQRNTGLLTNLLAMSRDAGASRFIFLSSMGVFEPGDGPAPGGRFTEATHPGATCPYAAAKRGGELLTASAGETGFETISLRLGNIAGPHEAVRETRRHLCLVQRMIAEARADCVITVQTPDALRDWSWLPDLADGIATLIDTPTPAQLLHAGTPPAITDLDLARAIAARAHGTTIRLAPEPRATVRPPMGSDIASVFDTLDWTPIERALDILMPMGASA